VARQRPPRERRKAVAGRAPRGGAGGSAVVARAVCAKAGAGWGSAREASAAHRTHRSAPAVRRRARGVGGGGGQGRCFVVPLFHVKHPRALS